MKLIILSLLSVAVWSQAAEVPDMLLSCFGGGALLVEDGDVVWNYGKGKRPCQDSWQLADGTFLVPTGDTVQIVNRDKKVLWKYQGETPRELLEKPEDLTEKQAKRWKPKTLEIHSCQPLPDGNVLITEGAHGRFIEVDKAGKIVAEIKPQGEKANNHSFNRIVRKTKQGTYVAALANDRYGEFDRDGKVLRMINKKSTKGHDEIVWKHVHGLVVLDNGNWLISTGYGACVFEIDQNNNVVWTLTPDDVSEVNMNFAAGLQRLADGTTVITTHKSPYAVFAVDKSKKVLWKYKSKIKGITNVQILSTPGRK